VHCGCCNETDRSKDPIEPAKNRLWGGYKDATNKEASSEVLTMVCVDIEIRLITDGGTCYYCFRVWNCRFMETYKLSVYKAELGKNHDLHEMVDKYLAWLIHEQLAEFEKTGNREAKLSWPSKAEIDVIEIREVVWEEPEDQFMEEDAYKAMYGDYENNGRGDVMGKGFGGRPMIKLNIPKVFLRKVRTIQQARKRRRVDDGNDAAANQFASERFAAISSRLTGDAIEFDPEAAVPASSSTFAIGLGPVPFGSSDDADILESLFMMTDKDGTEPVPPPQGSRSACPAPDTPAARRQRAKASPPTKAKTPAPHVTPSAPTPKPKTTPKPKVASGSSSNPGRPKRDSQMLLRCGLKELGTAIASSKKFFGDEFKNTNRNWQSYIKDVGTEIAECGDADITLEFQLLEKQAIGARKVLQAIQAKGLADSFTVKTYMSEMAWFATVPAVASPFPPYIQGVMHDASIADAWPPCVFLDLLKDRTIGEMTPDGRVEQRQIECLSQKVWGSWIPGWGPRPGRGGRGGRWGLRGAFF